MRITLQPKSHIYNMGAIDDETSPYHTSFLSKKVKEFDLKVSQVHCASHHAMLVCQDETIYGIDYPEWKNHREESGEFPEPN